MKLDRNINPDGRGKYALINLRKISDEEYSEMLYARRDKESFALDSECLQLGDEKGEAFFVIKYKDKFAAAALQAYGDAVAKEATNLRYGKTGPVDTDKAAELREYAAEIEREVLRIRALHLQLGGKLPD